MNTRKVSKTLFQQLVLSLDRADSDCASLVLDAGDLREIRLCAESHGVAQFARYALPCIVVPDNAPLCRQPRHAGPMKRKLKAKAGCPAMNCYASKLLQ